MEYNLLELIAMLEDVVRSATPVPFGKKSMVDVARIDEIATEMRLVIPREIVDAQNVVADKNRIIDDAKRQAEDIIRKAEERRNQLLDENSIMQEAKKKATEEIAQAQARSNLIRSSTHEFSDKMLGRVEELMAKDLNDLRILRKTLNSNEQAPKTVQPQQIQRAQAQPQQPQGQQPQRAPQPR